VSGGFGGRGAPPDQDAGFERELGVLEKSIKRLTADCDAFLYGSSSKPPVEARKHIEEMLRRLNASEALSSAERYRFATLQGRYSALVERWERLMAEKESGRRPGLYGHFRPSMGSPAGHPTGPAPPPNAARPGSVEGERGAVPVDPDRDLFERYVAAKKSRGEDVSGYRLDGFLEGLERERRKLREKAGAGDIVFEVAERDGRVRLIAKKKKGTA
jgi:hypothetical protein